jgi:hypothetical protein
MIGCDGERRLQRWKIPGGTFRTKCAILVSMFRLIFLALALTWLFVAFHRPAALSNPEPRLAAPAKALSVSELGVLNDGEGESGGSEVSNAPGTPPDRSRSIQSAIVATVTPSASCEVEACSAFMARAPPCRPEIIVNLASTLSEGHHGGRSSPQRHRCAATQAVPRHIVVDLHL